MNIEHIEIIKKLKPILANYGKVEQCEVIDEMLHIKITDGFNANARESFELVGKISEISKNEFPLVSKMFVDKNIYHLIVKKSNHAT